MARTVDWTALEQLLLREATTALADFAAEHPDDVFYGAVLDVEPYDGASVSLHLNTEAHLTAENDGKPVPADDLHSRFLPGAFEHTLDLSETDEFPGDEIEAAVERDLEDPDADDDDPKTATYQLLELACRLGFALEQTAFQQLKRTDDFTIAVTRDPREPGDFSVARYAKFKNKALRERRSSPLLINKPKPGV